MDPGGSNVNVESIPNDMFLLYRRCHVGLAMFNALDELLETGDLSLDQAIRVVQQFDFVLQTLFTKTGQSFDNGLMTFKAERCLTYRKHDFCDILLSNVTFYQYFSCHYVNMFLDYLQYVYAYDPEHPILIRIKRPKGSSRAQWVKDGEFLLAPIERQVSVVRIMCQDPFRRGINKSRVMHDGQWFNIDRTIYALPNPRLYFFTCSVYGAGTNGKAHEPWKYEAKEVDPRGLSRAIETSQSIDERLESGPAAAKSRAVAQKTNYWRLGPSSRFNNNYQGDKTRPSNCDSNVTSNCDSNVTSAVEIRSSQSLQRSSKST